MRRGRLLEPVAIQMLREDRPDWVVQDYPVGFYYRDPAARMGATPDALVINELGRLGSVQIKSVEPSIFRRDWKQDDGSIEPPLWIVVQGIIEAHLTGAQWAAVAPMVIGFGVELPVIPIPIHAGVLDRIKGEIASFWQRVQEGRPYAPDYGRDGALIAKLYPDDNGCEIDLSADNELPGLVDDLENIRGAKRTCENQEKFAKAAIAAKMGEAAIARIADGRRITFKKTSRAGYAVEATSFRTIRVLKGR